MESILGSSSVRLAAAKVRAESIRTQLSAASTLCDTVETEIKFDQRDRAKALLQKLRRAAEIIDMHLHEQGHVPDSELSDLKHGLKCLDLRIIALEQELAE